MIASLLRRAADWLDPPAPEAGDPVVYLSAACRLFTQGVGENGYYPTLGAAKMAAALEYMRRAGVEPVWHPGVSFMEAEAENDEEEEDGGHSDR